MHSIKLGLFKQNKTVVGNTIQYVEVLVEQKASLHFKHVKWLGHPHLEGKRSSMFCICKLAVRLQNCGQIALKRFYNPLDNNLGQLYLYF